MNVQGQNKGEIEECKRETVSIEEIPIIKEISLPKTEAVAENAAPQTEEHREPQKPQRDTVYEKQFILDFIRV